jgi:hypothetical protein
MYALVSYKIPLVNECLITHITIIRAVTSMYALMCYQTAPNTECFITQITIIRALTSMYALMCYKNTLLIECLITNFTGIRTLTTMYAFMRFQSAPFTEYLTARFTCIWMLTTMYIAGISTFSTVYVMMFIQRTLLKTQSLNIRMYSDRKNNYFLSKYTLNKNPLHLKNCVIYKDYLMTNNFL